MWASKQPRQIVTTAVVKHLRPHLYGLGCSRQPSPQLT